MRSLESFTKEAIPLDPPKNISKIVEQEFSSRLRRAKLTGTEVFLTDNNPSRAGITIGENKVLQVVSTTVRVDVLNNLISAKGVKMDDFRHGAQLTTDDPELNIIVKSYAAVTSRGTRSITAVYAKGLDVSTHTNSGKIV